MSSFSLGVRGMKNKTGGEQLIMIVFTMLSIKEVIGFENRWQNNGFGQRFRQPPPVNGITIL